MVQTIVPMMAKDRRSPLIAAYEKATGEYGLCPNRVWAVCGGELHNILPADKQGIRSHQDHDQCTYEFCEYSQMDFTAVSQRHECAQPRDTCTPLLDLFPPGKLEDAVRADQPTAWTLDGRNTIEGHQHYMAISHVWSDGTGSGAWAAGQMNRCLYRFFREVAYRFQCDGLWWDTLCIPQDKVLRTKAIRSMHRRYRDARVTLVHDVFLRESPWVSAEHACFAILMSPWFSRGWTSLELAESRKVKFMFGGTSGPVIKDLDHDILSKDEGDSIAHQMASQLIRNLRKSRDDLNQILTVLGARSTSWPKDVTIIAGLLAGVSLAQQPGQANLSPQDIIVRILTKMGRIFPGHLFHNTATMSKGTSWCPISLLSIPVSDAAETASLRIDQSFNVVGRWKTFRLQPPELLEARCVWGSVHPFARERVLNYLRTTRDQAMLLAECTATPITRALLVHSEGMLSGDHLECRLIGALYFHPPLESAELGGDGIDQTAHVVIRGGFDEKSLSHNTPAASPLDGGHHNTQSAPPQGEDAAPAALSWNLLHVAAWRGLDDSPMASKALSGSDGTGEGRDLLHEEDSLGRQPLHLAAERGDIQLVKFILDHSSILSGTDRQGRTALHFAAWGGSGPVVDALLHHGFDHNAEDADGKMALHYACEQGNLDVVTRLLQYSETKLEGMKNPRGLTALHYAAYYGHVAIVELLVAKGNPGDIHIQEDQFGWTPLHLAALNGQDDITKILLRNGAQAAVRGTHIDWTPLHCAAAGRKSVGAIKHLLECKSPPEAQDEYGWTVSQLARLSNRKDVLEILNEDQVDVDAVTTPPVMKPVHAVAAYGPQALARLLFRFQAAELISLPWESSYIASQDAPVDEKGQSLLHSAVLHDRRGLVQQLIDENHDLNLADQSRFTPLYCALDSGRTELTRLLLRKGARTDQQAADSRTVLHLAAKTGYEEIFDKRPVRKYVDQLDAWQQTPLHIAAVYGQLGFMGRLLANRAKVDAKDAFGATPLFRSAEAGHLDAMKLLLQLSANAADKDFRNTSMLAAACRGRHKHVVQYLLGPPFSFSVDTRNNDGDSAMDFAVYFGDADVVMLLFTLDRPREEADSEEDEWQVEEVETSAEVVKSLLFGQGTSSATQAALLEVAHKGYEKGEDDDLSVEDLEELVIEEDYPEHLSPKIRDISGAAEIIHQRVVRLLICAGADTDITIDGRPLITWAGELGNVEILAALVETRHVDVDTLDNPGTAGQTPLGYAIDSGNTDAVRYLVSQGANICHIGNGGRTPLHVAITSHQRKPDIVMYLVEEAMRSTSNFDVRAALAAAIRHFDEPYDEVPRLPEIIELLRKYFENYA